MSSAAAKAEREALLLQQQAEERQMMEALVAAAAEQPILDKELEQLLVLPGASSRKEPPTLFDLQQQGAIGLSSTAKGLAGSRSNNSSNSHAAAGEELSVDAVLRFCFPQHILHPRSTGRLYVLAEYGPACDIHSYECLCPECKVKTQEVCELRGSFLVRILLSFYMTLVLPSYRIQPDSAATWQRSCARNLSRQAALLFERHTGCHCSNSSEPQYTCRRHGDFVFARDLHSLSHAPATAAPAHAHPQPLALERVHAVHNGVAQQ